MAKITYTSIHWDGTEIPADCLEVRFWGTAGREGQFFNIGSGGNFSADGNVWMELLYTVHGAQIFYTRTFLHSFDNFNAASLEERFDEIAAEGEGHFGFGDMLPESGIGLKFTKIKHYVGNGQEKSYPYCTLEVDIDTSAVFSKSPPGERMITVALKGVPFEDSVQFMHDLIHELGDAHQGKHPNPALLPSEMSEWPFARKLNEKAYNLLSSDYQEKYFEHPLLTEAFDGWLAQLPPGAHVLDAGCGHGDPVIARLLEKGFQVTGTDFSPAMIEKARERFPQASYIQKMTTEIDFEQQFDGACSFSSILYLDPIDFFHSIYRLYRALKPGGLLFLYGHDLHPTWRGVPLDTVMKQWMWSWTYGMDEVVLALEEHGFFEVFVAEDVTTPEDRAETRARIIKQMRENDRRLNAMVAEIQARYAAQGQENMPRVKPLSLSEAGSMLAAAPKMPQTNTAGSEAAQQAEETDAEQVDQAALKDPKYDIPAEKMSYHYVVIARRK